mmetsp:Transcript_5937/g.17767  ORF Transcript_5937/g.17767 Transcript_5937/m.17767 type:complete len:222 (+) Transcript_5937:599-1264(+)
MSSKGVQRRVGRCRRRCRCVGSGGAPGLPKGEHPRLAAAELVEVPTTGGQRDQPTVRCIVAMGREGLEHGTCFRERPQHPVRVNEPAVAVRLRRSGEEVVLEVGARRHHRHQIAVGHPGPVLDQHWEALDLVEAGGETANPPRQLAGVERAVQRNGRREDVVHRAPMHPGPRSVPQRVVIPVEHHRHPRAQCPPPATHGGHRRQDPAGPCQREHVLQQLVR